MHDKYNPQESELRWLNHWEEKKVYAFNADSESEIYSIDTPPPTVSGKMHLGHSFSYSQQDFIARFQRMRGMNVFYPFGTDDNGLATERMIEQMKKVKGKNMPRKEFVELCLKTLEEIRPDFIYDWKRLGVSADYSIFYTTINEHCQRVSQGSFLELYKKGRIYRKYAPVIFCPQCQTAIAQVEMEDKESKSTLNYVKAKSKDAFIVYATTRPELLHGCVGMSIKESGVYTEIDVSGEKWIVSKDSLISLTKHDIQFTILREFLGKELVGREVEIPLSKVKTMITHDEVTETQYGTGIVYYCTYGGYDCVEWMIRHPDAKPIHIMGTNGKYNEKNGPYAGLNSIEARKKVLEDMEKEKYLIFKEPITHIVNVHERCGTDIEYIATNQWFIKYLDLKYGFLDFGRKIKWHPEHMRNRYENWVHGLKWDWNISRQRHFGVPIPVWYSKKTQEIILPEQSQLPIDPLTEFPKTLPKNHSKEDLEAEKDVLDTWATSSLTPDITIELFDDPKLRKKLHPMDLRPQAHDIITFWLFNTTVKSYFHHNSIPWKNSMISGWALDPHGKKMSKSKGNVIDPREMISRYSADALRFWAAGSRLGDDLPFQEKDLKTGVKFTTKIWNAAKFSYGHLLDYTGEKPNHLEMMDKWLLSKLSRLILFATQSFDKYEYSHAKLETEKFFFQIFCDNYLELIKDRIYNPQKRGREGQLSAQYALYTGLYSVLKLMAPITPFITEELYQSYYKKIEQKDSIHNTNWPSLDMVDERAESAGDFFVYVLSQVRKAKSEKNKSMKEPVIRLLCKGKITLEDFNSIKTDLAATTNAQEIVFDELDANSEIDYEVVVDL